MPVTFSDEILREMAILLKEIAGGMKRIVEINEPFYPPPRSEYDA